MNNLEKVQEKLDEVQIKVEQNTLALEMLRELKKSAQRKFIIIVILIIALIGTNVGWLIYNSQFEIVADTEETIVDGGNGVATYLENSNSGDINYGKDN